MNSLKRIFVSIKSQLDHVADEFENHEALAGIAIEDLQAIASKTRLHLHRVSKMTEQYQKKLTEQREQAILWSERAVKMRSENEQKALQCVKRLRETQQRIKSLEHQCQESMAQEEKLRTDAELVNEQLQALKNKKEMLAARQNRAALQDTLDDYPSHSLQNVQTVFERWEGAVVSSEFTTEPPVTDVDTLTKEFEQEEDVLALKAMLDELTEQSDSAYQNT